MPHLLWLAFLLPILSLSAADNNTTYNALLARAQSGDLTIDFRQLRLSCLQAKHCDPEGNPDTKKQLYSAIRAGDNAQTVKAAEQLIAAGFPNIEAHMFASTAYEKFGDHDKAKFHHDIASALLRSIFATGDGKSKETAFEVICVAEEYTVVSVMGLPRLGDQSLISGKPHSYDLLTRTDPKSNNKVEIYFNIDAFYPSKLF